VLFGIISNIIPRFRRRSKQMGYRETHFFKIDETGNTKSFYNNKYSSGFLVNLSQHEKETLSSTLLKVGRMATGTNILDIGCGTGRFSLAIPPGFSYTGVDFSRKAIELAQKRFATPNIRFCVADAVNSPFRESEFDIVICLGSLEHFPDMHQCLLEMKRVTRSDGKIYIEVPNLWFIGLYIHYCFRKSSPYSGQEIDRYAGLDSWIGLFNASGLKVDSYWGRNYIYRGWRPDHHITFNLGNRLLPNHLRQNLCFILSCD